MSDNPAQSHLTVEDAGTTTDPADLANSGVGHAVRHDEDPVGSADEVVRATDGVPERDGTAGATAADPAITEFVVDEEGTAEPLRSSDEQRPTEPTQRIDEQPRVAEQPTDAHDRPTEQVQEEQVQRTQPVDEQPRAADQPTDAHDRPTEQVQQEQVQRTQPVDEQPRAADQPTEPDSRRGTEPASEPPTSPAEPVEPAGSRAAEPADRPDLAALADSDIGHVFDQTNGVIERADGDSDGSGESDVRSGSLRSEDDPTVEDAGVHGDGEVPETRRTGD